MRDHRGRRFEPRARLRPVGRNGHLDQRPQIRQGNHDLPLRDDAQPGFRREQEPRAGQSGGRFDRHRLRRHVGRAEQPRRTGADDEEFRGGFPDFRYEGVRPADHDPPRPTTTARVWSTRRHAADCGTSSARTATGRLRSAFRAASTRPWWPRSPPMRWGRRMSARC